MGADSKIEWTTHTMNPWWGCAKVADGCTHCYAEAFSKRTGKAKWGVNGTRVKMSESYWKQPLKWNKAAEKAGERHRVFCASMADVFEEWDGEVSLTGDDLTMCCPSCGLGCGMPVIQAQLGPPMDECPRCKATMQEPTLSGLRRMLFALIDATPNLDWLLLTKRPENIIRMWPIQADGEAAVFPGMPGPLGQPIPCHRRKRRENVWLLTSIATQADADRNIPLLLKCRDLAPVLGVSAEPLLGPVTLLNVGEKDGRPLSALANHPCVDDEPGYGLDWVIVGGESGHGARPCDVEWIRSIRDQCAAAGVPCFVKQLGSKPHDNGGKLLLRQPGGSWHFKDSCRDSKGGDQSEWPEPFRVRQFPQQSEVAHAPHAD